MKNRKLIIAGVAALAVALGGVYIGAEKSDDSAAGKAAKHDRAQKKDEADPMAGSPAKAAKAAAERKTDWSEKKVASPVAEVGKAAPEFALADADGKVVKLADLKGKVVVLEWTNPDCPFVQKHYNNATTMIDLQKKYAEQGVVWLAVNSTSYNKAENSREWAKSKGIDYPTLIDSDGAVGKAYGATTTPNMYVINAEGTLVYAGAIDNDRTPKTADPTQAGYLNYVDAAVASTLKGEPIAESETKPYGCSVKYLQ